VKVDKQIDPFVTIRRVRLVGAHCSRCLSLFLFAVLVIDESKYCNQRYHPTYKHYHLSSYYSYIIANIQAESNRILKIVYAV
jgi:hypothetical protein